MKSWLCGCRLGAEFMGIGSCPIGATPFLPPKGWLPVVRPSCLNAPLRSVSPFVNPYDPSHQQQDLLDGNLAGLLAGRTFTTVRPAPPGLPSTPRPERFFPPGQIKLDRFPEGFNFDFKSQ